MADINNVQLDALVGNLRAEAEKLRALKFRVDSLIARTPQFATEISLAKAEDVIISARKDVDALSFPTVDVKAYNDIVYALGTLKNQLDTISLETLEKLCPRSFEANQ